MFSQIEQYFRELVPAVDFCSLRLVSERHESLTVRRDVVEPVQRSEDLGAMITVFDGGLGYAATPDLGRTGLQRAIQQAHDWARVTAGRGLVELTALEQEPRLGEYRSPVQQPWSSLPLADKLERLRRECARLKVDDAIIEWRAGLWHSGIETLYLTAAGGRIHQRFEMLLPSLSASAHRHGETQTRSFGRGAHYRQGGLEILKETGFYDAAPAIAQQALELLAAPNCPTGTLDLLLAPDQMILQIHESIGHPLELDRILGDERNYAGTSFVTPDMFGSYRYGSELLNVTSLRSLISTPRLIQVSIISGSQVSRSCPLSPSTVFCQLSLVIFFQPSSLRSSMFQPVIFKNCIKYLTAMSGSFSKCCRIFCTISGRAILV